ncbi:MAG: LysM domain [Gaiellaceae bacterium]|nr:LysM domain [Gaiellaceae bacterium]
MSPGRRGLARFLAPAAFLLAVTIAVLLVRSALRNSSDAGSPSQTSSIPTGTGAVTTTRPHKPGVRVKRVYYTIQSGDTLGGVASKKQTTVAQIMRFNPGIDPHALRVGQKVRVG